MKTSKTIKSRASVANERCGWAYGIARQQVVKAVLIAGILWGYTPSQAIEGEFLCASRALSSICDANMNAPLHSILIPDLGLVLLETSGGGSLVERSIGTGVFTTVLNDVSDPTIQFDVDLTFSGRLDSGDEGFPPPGSPILDMQPFCTAVIDTEAWHYYTALTGTMTGRSGSIYSGLVFSVTLEATAAQLGWSANNRAQLDGLLAAVLVELVSDPPDESFPDWPMIARITLQTTPGCIPPPVVDVTGTWTGTIECAGFDLDVDAVAQEKISTDVVLKFGNRSDFSQYSAQLTENSTVETFCGRVSNDRENTQTGQGGLISSTGTAAPAFLKVADVDREASPDPTGELRARQVVVTPEGAMLCKWSLTLTDTADPQIADSCTP